MASDDKFGRLRQLVDSGKEKGYVLYDEVNDLLPDDIATGPELDDLLADFDSAGVEILEEPKLEFDKKLEDGEEFAELDLAQDYGDKTNDPVRMYLREMGTVPLLTREGEIELAKRIERGQRSVNKSLSRSPLIIREIAAFAEEIRKGQLHAADVLITTDPIALDEEGAPIRRRHSYWQTSKRSRNSTTGPSYAGRSLRVSSVRQNRGSIVVCASNSAGSSSPFRIRFARYLSHPPLDGS